MGLSPALWVVTPCCLFTMDVPCACVSCASSYKDTNQIDLGPTLTATFLLNCLFKGLIYKYSHILRYWGLGLQHMNVGWGEGNLAHNSYCFISLAPSEFELHKSTYTWVFLVDVYFSGFSQFNVFLLSGLF